MPDGALGPRSPILSALFSGRYRHHGSLGPRSPILSALFSGRYRHHGFVARSGGGSDADQHQTAGRDSRNRGLAEAEAWGQGGGKGRKKGEKVGAKGEKGTRSEERRVGRGWRGRWTRE